MFELSLETEFSFFFISVERVGEIEGTFRTGVLFIAV